MEDEAAAAQAAQEAFEALDSENNSLMSPCRSSIRSPGSGGSGRSGSSRKKNGVAGKKMKLEDMLAECSLGEPEEEFTGISCLLITWKSNPEVQQFKVSRSSKQTYIHQLPFSDRSSTWRNAKKRTRSPRKLWTRRI